MAACFVHAILAARGSGPMLGCSSMPPLVVAVDPQNRSHLLAGTDLGLLGSRNGGLTWTPEAPDLIFGAVFAVTFSRRR